MDINVDLLQWFTNFSDRHAQLETLAARNKFAGSGIRNKNISNKWCAQELRKPIIRKFEKQKVYSSFMANILAANLVDTQLISKFNKGQIPFLLCVIDMFSKYACIITLKDKKGTTITNASQKILDESNWKTNKSMGR